MQYTYLIMKTKNRNFNFVEKLKGKGRLDFGDQIILNLGGKNMNQKKLSFIHKLLVQIIKNRDK